jgi:pimeloyl-ACP methyl ester carboxylesterase
MIRPFIFIAITLAVLASLRPANASPLFGARPKNIRSIKMTDGLSVVTYEWGNAAGPELLFIHGAYQSALAWHRQMESELATRYRMVAYDLLGHGASDKPNDPQPYQDGKSWAGELNAVIEAMGLRHPTLIAWSLGGMIVGDYHAQSGEKRIAGIIFVDASTRSEPGMFHPGLAKINASAQVDDPAQLINGTKEFLQACVNRPWDPKELEFAVAYNMMTPFYVRRYITIRPAHYEQTLAAVTVPVLAIHGEQDRIILPAMSEYTAHAVKHGRLLIYPGVGHSPFAEDADRFNQDLDSFVKKLPRAR